MVDWNRVENLKTEVGEDDFDEVVALFLEEVDEVIGRLKANPDPSTYEADLHFLKGSALSLGFASFGDQCRLGEQLSASGKADQVDIDKLAEVYGKSRTTFLTGLTAMRRTNTAA